MRRCSFSRRDGFSMVAGGVATEADAMSVVEEGAAAWDLHRRRLVGKEILPKETKLASLVKGDPLANTTFDKSKRMSD